MAKQPTLGHEEDDQETLMEVESQGSKIISINNMVVSKLPEIEIIKVQGATDKPGSSSER